MAHHVSVCEVEDDHVLFSGTDFGDEFFGHFRSAHLGQEVIGRDFGAVHKDAVFVFKDGFTAAVEEEGHVGVFLGFGNPELVLAGL